MTTLLDRPGEQRQSEKISRAVLEDYLLKEQVISSPVLEILQFSGGASNLTYQVRTAAEDLILRRPPFGRKAKTAHDMNREFRILSALCSVLDFCPEPVHYCADEQILGSPFYLMRRIEGVIIRRDMPAALGTSAVIHQRMCEEFVRTLVRLHEINAGDVGLDDFGKPQGYVSRQVHGWTKRLRAAVTSGTTNFDDLARWLESEMPDDCPHSAIIHNDFKFDNVVWSQSGFASGEPRIIGVLDWEMATLGDPLMDMGAVLAYWIEADDDPMMLRTRMMPTHLQGMPGRDQLSRLYLEQRGWAAQNLEYYRTFGLFRLAVIVQQIFYRFDLGQSDNPKFAPFGDLANLLINAAQKAAGLSPVGR